MCYHDFAVDRGRRSGQRRAGDPRVMTDGGKPDEDPEESESETADETPDGERSGVDVMEPGEAEPAEPKWEPPDIDDIPEFEVTAGDPVVESETTDTPSEPESAGETGEVSGTRGSAGMPDDPTAGMPNDARAPGATAVSSQGTEAYVAALELCARLPEEVRLPDSAADLVPAAVEAELEQDIQGFAAAEFDNTRPHVDTLSFEEVDDEIWLRIRIGVPIEGFQSIDPEEIRSYALTQLEGVF